MIVNHIGSQPRLRKIMHCTVFAVWKAVYGNDERALSQPMSKPLC